MNKIIYRVDGGRVWGVSMGHIKRALISANALANSAAVSFIMKDYPDGVSYVRDAGFDIHTIDKDDNSDRTLINLVKKENPSTVIFDLRETPYREFFKYARGQNIKTVVFDILGKCSGAPDIVINDSIVSKYTSYSFDGDKTSLYTGPQYFLSNELPKPSPINNEIINIAVTMGGSDPAALTKKIVKFLVKKQNAKKYHIILGPLFSEECEKEIRNMCKTKQNFQIYRNPSSFLGLLVKQDLVICAGGRTLYESAYLGRPTIVVPSIEHEDVTAQEYSKLTKCPNVGLWSDKTPQKINDAMVQYENIEFRKEVSALGRSLVDGNAYNRIMNIIN